ncbi:MAG: histidinol-phosphatase [Bacteroidales bacterium]|nr:histidinol-phosphatase [Bacteroidales bacterium]
MKLYNLHTHSTYCDGKEPLEDMVKAAIEQGFDTLGLTSHSPLPFDTYFSIKENKLKEYVQEIDQLKEKYKGQIRLLRSLELEYVPGLSPEFAQLKEQVKMDYTLGSIHLIKAPNEELWFIDGPKQETYDEGLKNFFGGDIKKAVQTYYHQLNDMIETQNPEIIGHFDKIKMHNQNRFFTEDEKWYKDLVVESLDLMKEKGSIIEFNTRGWYKKKTTDLFPGKKWMPIIREMKIPVIISSDAHHSSELSLYIDETRQLLIDNSFKAVMYPVNGDWVEMAL